MFSPLDLQLRNVNRKDLRAAISTAESLSDLLYVRYRMNPATKVEGPTSKRIFIFNRGLKYEPGKMVQERASVGGSVAASRLLARSNGEEFGDGKK